MSERLSEEEIEKYLRLVPEQGRGEIDCRKFRSLCDEVLELRKLRKLLDAVTRCALAETRPPFDLMAQACRAVGTVEDQPAPKPPGMTPEEMEARAVEFDKALQESADAEWSDSEFAQLWRELARMNRIITQPWTVGGIKIE